MPNIYTNLKNWIWSSGGSRKNSQKVYGFQTKFGWKWNQTRSRASQEQVRSHILNSIHGRLASSWLLPVAMIQKLSSCQISTIFTPQPIDLLASCKKSAQKSTLRMHRLLTAHFVCRSFLPVWTSGSSVNHFSVNACVVAQTWTLTNQW
jgi:hypothetical protein